MPKFLHSIPEIIDSKYSISSFTLHLDVVFIVIMNRFHFYLDENDRLLHGSEQWHL